jgi:hypothetical protein
MTTSPSLDETQQTCDERLQKALRVYLARLSRSEQPEGRWQDHGVGAWYPSDDERQTCCRRHTPSTRNEQVLLQHCRSPEHVAALHRVLLADLRRAIRQHRRTTPRTR